MKRAKPDRRGESLYQISHKLNTNNHSDHNGQNMSDFTEGNSQWGDPLFTEDLAITAFPSHRPLPSPMPLGSRAKSTHTNTHAHTQSRSLLHDHQCYLPPHPQPPSPKTHVQAVCCGNREYGGSALEMLANSGCQ